MRQIGEGLEEGVEGGWCNRSQAIADMGSDAFFEDGAIRRPQGAVVVAGRSLRRCVLRASAMVAGQVFGGSSRAVCCVSDREAFALLISMI